MALMGSPCVRMNFPAAFPGRQAGRVWLRVMVGAAIAIVVLFLGAFVALSFVDWNRYILLAAAEVKAATGRELKVGGSIEVGFLPLRVIVQNVSLSNAAWGSRPQMVMARRVEVRAALLPLLTGDVRLKIDIAEPDVLLETDAKGMGNWVLVTQAKKQAPATLRGSSQLPVDLDTVRITKGAIQYRSGRTGKTRRLTFDQASIRPSGLSGREILVKATIDGTPVSLSATTDKLLVSTLGGGETLGIELKASTTGASFAAAGRIGIPASGPQLELKVHAEIGDTATLAKIAGVGIPRLPPIRLDGEINAGKRMYGFESVNVSMGKSAASGTIKADLSGARPSISANVAAPLIDLLEVMEARGPSAARRSPAASAPPRLFSMDRLPFAGLDAVDADIDVKIERLVLPPALLFEAVRGKVTLIRGKLETRSLGMRMGGGDVMLTGGLDAAGNAQAKLGARVAGRNIDLGKMMASLGRGDLVSGGQIELNADLRATGESPAALAGALDGRVKIVMGPARTRNRVLDQAGMDILAQVLNAVNPARKTEQYTQIQCAVINVPVQRGVITVDRTAAVETNYVGIAMAGTVNLADESVDLSVRPEAKGGIGVSVGGLASLVKVQGTLLDPKIGVDFAGAAGAAAQIGIGVMTGGLSILAKGLFDKATMEAPCKTALDRGAAPTASGNSADQGAGQPATGGIGGFLDRLFK